MNREQRRRMGGKLFPDDKGSVGLVMGIRDNQVVVEFANNLRWFSVGLAEGQDFVDKMQAQLDELKEQQNG